MKTSSYHPISHYRTAAEFLAYARELGIELPFESEVQSAPESPMAQPVF